MKVFNKFKKIILGVETIIFTLSTKVWANDIISEDFFEPAYGVKNPAIKSNYTIKVFEFMVIPILLILGLITYCIKSKSSIKRKTIVTIISTVIAIGICLAIYFAIYNRTI